MIPVLRQRPLLVAFGTLQQQAGSEGILPIVNDTVWSSTGRSAYLHSLAGDWPTQHAYAGSKYR